MSAQTQSRVQLDEGAGSCRERPDHEGISAGPPSRWRRVTALPRGVPAVPESARTRRRVGAVLVGLVVLAAMGAGTAGWFAMRSAATEQASAAALDAARTKLPLVLSYGVDTLDADLDRAREQISGDFAARFDELAATLIVPTTRSQKIDTTAVVVRGAVIGSAADRVETVLYVNQSTTTAARPDAQKTASQVKVVMSNVDGQWLISEVTPI